MENEDEDGYDINVNGHHPVIEVSDYTGESDMEFTVEDHSIFSSDFEQTPVCIDVANSKRLVAVGAMDDCCTIFSVDSGSSIKLEGHKDTVSGVKFATDSGLIATCGYDSTVKIWSTNVAADLLKNPICPITKEDTEILLHTMEVESEAEWVEWHPKGNSLVCGTSAGNIWLWLVSLKRVRLMRFFSGGHFGRVTCGSFSLDGHSIMSCGGEGLFCEWQPKEESNVHRIDLKGGANRDVYLTPGEPYENCDYLISLASLHNRATAVGANDGTIFFVRTGAVLGKITIHHAPVETICLSGNGMFLGAASMDGMISVWETQGILDSRVPRALLTESCGVTKHLFVEDTSLLCCGLADGRVVVIDCLEGRIVREILGNTGTIMDMNILAIEPGEPVIGSLLETCATKPSLFVVTASDPLSFKIFALD